MHIKKTTIGKKMDITIDITKLLCTLRFVIMFFIGNLSRYPKANFFTKQSPIRLQGSY